MKGTLVLVFGVFALVLSGCGGEKKDALTEFKIELEQKKRNTAESPYKVALAAINIAANKEDVNAIIEKAGKFVALDISACAVPNDTIAGFSGISGYVKGIILPDIVTSIADDTFDKDSGLTSITIPASVTSVTEDAFDGCTGLENIIVDGKNATFSSVEGVLFNKDKTELVLCPEGKSGTYTIPATVTVISDSAFEACKLLTSVVIPPSVTTIGKGAFARCEGLTSLDIPDSVTSVGDGAFKGSGLTSISTPNWLRGTWTQSSYTIIVSDTDFVIQYGGENAQKGTFSIVSEGKILGRQTHTWSSGQWKANSGEDTVDYKLEGNTVTLRGGGVSGTWTRKQ